MTQRVATVSPRSPAHACHVSRVLPLIVREQVSTTKEKFSCLSVDIDVSKKSQRGGAICSLFDCFAKLCAEEVRVCKCLELSV